MSNLKDLLLLVRHRAYFEDGLLTRHVAGFSTSAKFTHAYEAGKATQSWGKSELRWRVHTCLWAAGNALKLDGDFVECGVNRGGMARAVMDYIGFNSLEKRFFLLDTYCGIPERYQGGSSFANEGEYSECYADVLETFSPFPSAKIIRGTIPDTLSQVSTEAVCYLSIDMNTVEPEIAAMRYFWPKLVSGASVVLDDYAYSEDYALQRKAFDDLARELNFNILTLPTGQGLIIKI